MLREVIQYMAIIDGTSLSAKLSCYGGRRGCHLPQ
jgi:hypothetical protein